MSLSYGDLDSSGQKQIMFVTENHRVKIYNMVFDHGKVRLDEYKISEIEKITNAVGAYFYDLDDIGSHSILVENTQGKLRAFLHVPKPGNYFLKALAFQKDYIGQSRTGISYQFLMTDIDGSEIVYAGAQSTSNSYRNLQLPFMLSGLGRCQNYIQHLTFGSYPDVFFHIK